MHLEYLPFNLSFTELDERKEVKFDQEIHDKSKEELNNLTL